MATQLSAPSLLICEGGVAKFSNWTAYHRGDLFAVMIEFSSTINGYPDVRAERHGDTPVRFAHMK
ncbi:hypothetical protein [Maridesulfovibrio sp.]|uniref:hypothetical protein n=1 Tax=Maridesulfovibrio sp. TaxID=2795000 RepID=UPI0029F5B67A|nr:hypothetical protein [Maridesulfovibrio sp.]